MSRVLTVFVLFCLVSTASANDDLVKAYRYAKRLRGEAQREFAAKNAPLFAESTVGKKNLYLGYLWAWAGEWPAAAQAFERYVAAAGASKNRPTGMLQQARALVESKDWKKVAPVVKRYLRDYPGQRYTGRMLFYLGRSRRVEGRLESALEAFAGGARAGNQLAAYEQADTLMQLGRYKEAAAALAEAGKSARTDTLRKALPQMGKPLPELSVDHWTDKRFDEEKVRTAPTLFAFWSTKAGKSRNRIHELGNGWAKRFQGKVQVVGPMPYLKFDPTTMRQEPDMSEGDEQDFVSGWASEYDVEYSLVIVSTHALHHACGVDPERPALPAFALSDAEGKLRYVRVIDGPWAIEAVESMLRRIAR